MSDEAFDLEKFKSVGFVGCRLRGDRATFQRDFEKQNASELADYAKTRKEGIQPKGTTRQHIDQAKAISDGLGVAFDAGDLTGTAVRAGMPPPREWTSEEKTEIRKRAIEGGKAVGGSKA